MGVKVCKCFGVADLPLRAYAHVRISSASMDVERFRQTLRGLRKQLVGSQAALSALTKGGENDTAVNTMTISEIETGAIADPGIVTVSRIIEAMPGLTLSSFFAQIEGLHLPDEPGQDATPPAEQVPNATPPVATLAESTFALEAIARTLIRSLIEQEFDRRDSERKNQSRQSKKSKGRANTRGNARRRA